MNHKSLNELVCAATVNVRFRETLLRDPAKALASGYYGHSFALTKEERDLVVGMRATGLEDFADQVYRFISGNGSVPAPAHRGHSGYNGSNGKGRKKETLPPAEAMVDLYRAPALVAA
jgi:hypothetical protein